MLPSAGPELLADHVPAVRSSDQELYQLIDAVVPQIARGSQISGEGPRFEGVHRSPAWMCVVPADPCTVMMFGVWLLDVFVPGCATLLKPVQGPASEAALAYTLSL